MASNYYPDSKLLSGYPDNTDICPIVVVCVCVHACVRACVRVCVRACGALVCVQCVCVQCRSGLPLKNLASLVDKIRTLIQPVITGNST